MKITFIYPDLIGSANYGGIFYVGIGSLSSVLKQAGYETSLIHVAQPITKSDFLTRIEKENSDMYVFSSTTMMFGYVKEWSGWIKERFKSLPIAVGGVHVWLEPEEVIKVDSIDFVCMGEGEYALLDLCNALSKSGDVSAIPNIWGKWKSRTFKNAPRPLIEDLDQLPFPDRTIFDYKNLQEGKENMVFFMASRGCPYNCPYCSNHALRAIYANCTSWVRFRSVENIITEIISVLKQYPDTKYIGFFDDILALKKDWFKKFTELYKKEIGLPFRCNMRANYLAEEETVKMLAEAGCKRVIIGLESGNEYVRNKVLNRNMPEKILLEAAYMCRKYGIELATYNMIGLPDESPGAMLDTIKLNAKIKADFTYASIYYPFKNTDLYELCKEKGMLTDKVVTDYVEGSALNFDRPSQSRILFMRNYFRPLMNLYEMAYGLPVGIGKRLEKILDTALLSRISCIIIFPFANWFFKSIRENRLGAAFINTIKLISTRKKIKNFLLKK